MADIITLYDYMGRIYTVTGKLAAIRVLVIKAQLMSGYRKDDIQLYTLKDTPILEDLWKQQSIVSTAYLQTCVPFTVLGTKCIDIPIMIVANSGKLSLWDAVFQRANAEQKLAAQALGIEVQSQKKVDLVISCRCVKKDITYVISANNVVEVNKLDEQKFPLFYPVLHILGCFDETVHFYMDRPAYVVSVNGTLEPFVQGKYPLLYAMLRESRDNAVWSQHAITMTLANEVLLKAPTRFYSSPVSYKIFDVVHEAIARGYQKNDASAMASEMLTQSQDSTLRMCNYNMPSVQREGAAMVRQALFFDEPRHRVLPQNIEALVIGPKAMHKDTVSHVPASVRCIALGYSNTSSNCINEQLMELHNERRVFPNIAFMQAKQLQSVQCHCDEMSVDNITALMTALQDAPVRVAITAGNVVNEKNVGSLSFIKAAESMELSFGNQPAETMLFSGCSTYRNSMIMTQPKLLIKYVAVKGAKYAASYGRKRCNTAIWIPYGQRRQIVVDMSDIKSGRHVVSFVDAYSQIRYAHTHEFDADVIAKGIARYGALGCYVPTEAELNRRIQQNATAAPLIMATMKISAMTCIELSGNMHLTVLASNTVKQLVLDVPVHHTTPTRVDVRANVQQLVLTTSSEMPCDYYLYGDIGTVSVMNTFSCNKTRIHVKKGTLQALLQRSNTVDIKDITITAGAKSYPNTDFEIYTDYTRSEHVTWERSSMFGGRVVTPYHTAFTRQRYESIKVIDASIFIEDL